MSGLAAFRDNINNISNGCSVNIADKNIAVNIEIAPKRLCTCLQS